MGHLSRGLVDRVILGQASEAEAERLCQHALVCTACRTLVAAGFEAAGRPSAKGEGPALPALLRVAASERERAVETVLANAELAALRQLGRKAQQERVLRAKACRSLPFVDQLLAQLGSAGSGDEAEFIASLLVQAVARMDETKLGPLREDLQAHAWTEVANSRRREVNWRRAETALAQAERLLAKGTGDPLAEARLLSVKASLRSDQGQRSEALRLLLPCKKLYMKAEAWPEVARTLVQEANVLVELSEPERALEELSQALPLIREEAILLYAELLRAECFLETQQLSAALRVYLETESEWMASPQKRILLRSRFLAARLLEALGRPREAVMLFEEVIARDLDHELFKDAFLDLLYLFGVHVRIGDPEGATAVCRRALGQMAALDLVHEQLHGLWAQLLEAARAGALDERALPAMSEYLRIFWRHPAPQAPRLTGLKERPVGEKKTDSALRRASDAEIPQTGIEALLAVAEWSALGQRSRKAQHERVIRAKVCHSLSFVNVLLGELRAAQTGDHAELLAALALRAANLMDGARHGRLRQDLQAQVWCELANSQRREARWRRAEDALAQAERLLEQGTGDRLVEARILSVKASLFSDLGRRSEAMAILLGCRKLYTEEKRWPLVARTLVQEANVLVEVEPEKALEALSQALPLIRDEEILFYAELLRAECFIETNQLPFALQAYLQTESKWQASPKRRVTLRGQFLGARLLEALGRHREAVSLFEAVIAGDLRYELYKDAFLDLLYLFGAFIRVGDAEGAIAVCRRALGQMEALDLVHEQLHAVWSQLMEAARIKALDEKILQEVKEYLRVFWRQPAPQAPKLNTTPGTGATEP